MFDLEIQCKDKKLATTIEKLICDFLWTNDIELENDSTIVYIALQKKHHIEDQVVS